MTERAERTERETERGEEYRFEALFALETFTSQPRRQKKKAAAKAKLFRERGIQVVNHICTRLVSLSFFFIFRVSLCVGILAHKTSKKTLFVCLSQQKLNTRARELRALSASCLLFRLFFLASLDSKALTNILKWYEPKRRILIQLNQSAWSFQRRRECN